MIVIGGIIACLGILGVAAILLLLTVERWLVPALGWLDARLTAMGFGKWSAGLLTRMEERFARRRRSADDGRP